MEASCQIDDCLIDFGPSELPHFPDLYAVVADAHPVPRVPPLRRDGDHTRFVKGGVRNGRGSDDLRPPSLNTGQTHILDFLSQSPPSSPEPTPTVPTTPKSKSTTPKKGSMTNKVRKMFSTKQSPIESRSSVFNLHRVFTAPSYRNNEEHEAAKISSGSGSGASPIIANHLQRGTAEHHDMPDIFEAHKTASEQAYRNPTRQTPPLHERGASRQGYAHRNKQPVITPLKLNRKGSSENTKALRSPCGYASAVSPNMHPASARIYGQPPPEMVSPVIPHKVTKEHLNLSNFPRLPREAIAQLPKDLEPTLPVFTEHGAPIPSDQLGSLRSVPGYPGGHDNDRTAIITRKSAPPDRARNSIEGRWPQSPPLPQLRHEQSMVSIQDEPATPEDYSVSPLPGIKFKKNGRVKKYKDNDPAMVSLGFVALEEIYGRQAAIDRFAGPSIVKAATWETQRAREKEEEEMIGLGISPRTSAQSFEAKELFRDRGYSNGSSGPTIHSPLTSRSEYVTPQTPKERQEFYESLHKKVAREMTCTKKAHGDFGLCRTSPPTHEEDPSMAPSPFDDPKAIGQSTTIPYTLGMPGALFYGQRQDSDRPDTYGLEPPADSTSSMGKIRGYFQGCSPDSIRNTRLHMSTKEMRVDILARLREVTSTQCVYRSTEPGQTKHPSHERHFDARNLRCTEHMGYCGVCSTACCVYFEVVEASEDAATAYSKEFAHEVGRTISEASYYADDLTTFLRCVECSRMVCPECVGICPVDLCQLVSCKVSHVLQCIPDGIDADVE
ncbi:MAG: hypothetical protein Q9169_002244 [Polycauliona sp. 2 TL-2023]